MPCLLYHGDIGCEGTTEQRRRGPSSFLSPFYIFSLLSCFSVPTFPFHPSFPSPPVVFPSLPSPLLLAPKRPSPIQLMGLGSAVSSPKAPSHSRAQFVIIVSGRPKCWDGVWLVCVRCHKLGDGSAPVPMAVAPMSSLTSAARTCNTVRWNNGVVYM